MNLSLSDEQEFLREAARGALSRFKTLEAAREALEGGALPDLWPTACEAGWPGLLISEARGGAGLSAFDATLVLGECGRVLAGVALLGHLPATVILEAAAHDDLEALAGGELRAVFVGAQPPDDRRDDWTVDARSGHARAAAPSLDGSGRVSGEVAWVLDAPGADLFVVVCEGGVAVAVPASEAAVESVPGYDATRSIGHVRFDSAQGTTLGSEHSARAWYLAQALIAAESLGSVETALEVSVVYAKERFTFGRAIGSYQAVKHALVEVLRLMENTRSLLFYAGWAYADKPEEFALAASAARSAGGRAFDYAARELISVHGGIGATWEHDAPLFFRRSQLSRRLLGGTAGATDRVAGEMLRAA